MKSLTKKGIERLAEEIKQFLKDHYIANAVSIYYNGAVYRSDAVWKFDEDPDKDDEYVVVWNKTEGVYPNQYFGYVNPKHILSMSFEGGLYNLLNNGSKLEDSFYDIFEKYGLYFELGHSWNLTAYPINDDMKVEYTKLPNY